MENRHEIEFKVKLTKEQFIEFFNKRFRENCCEGGVIIYDSFYDKNDYYYKSPNKDDVIRIRDEIKRVFKMVKENTNPFKCCDKSDMIKALSFLCYKNKLIINGIEVNEEIETTIENEIVFDKIMESLGVEQYFHKNKKSILIDSQTGDEFVDYGIKYNIELVCVNDKYYYLEAEYIGLIGKDEKIKSASDAIKFLETRKIIKDNFDVSVKDPRSWIEIINSDEK